MDDKTIISHNRGIIQLRELSKNEDFKSIIYKLDNNNRTISSYLKDLARLHEKIHNNDSMIRLENSWLVDLFTHMSDFLNQDNNKIQNIGKNL